MAPVTPPTVSKERWNQGFQLGMFGNNPLFSSITALSESPSFKDQPDSVKRSLLDATVINNLVGLQYSPEARQAERERLAEVEESFLRRAKAQQELGKESLAETAKYKMLLGIPETIGRAASLPGAIYAQGGQNIASIIADATRSIPAPLNLARGSQYSVPTYF